MRKLVLAAAAGALILATAPAALAGPKRADSYYTVHCIDPVGSQSVAESVDAQAIEQGGKGDAIENFNANHPGWSCWAEGPFNP
jgi:hypothetical protein